MIISILDYPNEKPEMSIISIDIKADEKEYLLSQLIEICEQYMGMAMTFILSSTLTQLLTDHHENWLNRLQSVCFCRITILFRLLPQKM